MLTRKEQIQKKTSAMERERESLVERAKHMAEQIKKIEIQMGSLLGFSDGSSDI